MQIRKSERKKILKKFIWDKKVNKSIWKKKSFVIVHRIFCQLVNNFFALLLSKINVLEMLVIFFPDSCYIANY